MNRRRLTHPLLAGLFLAGLWLLQLPAFETHAHAFDVEQPQAGDDRP
jgi:hypothetical protein